MDQVQQVREKTDIVTLLSEYLPLKQMGRNFRCPCPFHVEKTPSFTVSPERQIWHCFGCQKGGDVFTFLMEYEHMEFGEALRFLAKRAGIELKEFHANSELTSQKERLYQINHLAMEFYHFVLTKHKAGKAALQYVTEVRQISPKVLETFGVGFSPKTGNALTQFLIGKKKYTEEDVLAAGLSTKRNNRIVDFFFNRLMFPLIDNRDNVVGFSARALDNSLPKYINTRETPIYSKSHHLFGINVTKNEIKQKNQALLVEGEFDAMSLFQAGLGNVVAVKGTALTEGQIALLKRFTGKITMCLDADAAGQAAIKRSLPIIEKQGLTTTVVLIPEGKDPDEAIKTNEFGFKQAVKHEENIYDFLLNLSLASKNANSPEGKQGVASELLPIYGEIENEIVKEHYLKKLGLALDTSIESLQMELQKRKTSNQKVTAPATGKKRAREELLEEYVMALLLQADNLSKALPISEIISSDVFSQPSLGRILNLYQEFIKNGGLDIAFFAKTLPSELLPAFDVCYLAPLPEFKDSESYYKELNKKTHELKLHFLQKRVAAMTDDSDAVAGLKQEYSEIKTKLQKM